jgi:16S rRNA (cytosine1402-N4)-methyltransferase
MDYPHKSVLLNEVLQAFEPLQLSTFIDGTLGAGGHALAILDSHPEIRQFIGIDQDPDARAIATGRLEKFKDKLTIIPGNFAEITDIAAKIPVDGVDGILLDLGVSSMQLDLPEKGFSFMHDGPLDMRMDPNNPTSAAVIVNTWPERELARIFRDYGEEKKWRIAARVIIEQRELNPINTTKELVDVLSRVLKKNPKKKIHPATLVFQALRIAVNSELAVLESVLPQAISLLRPGGRLAIISFHRLEDRIVKEFFREAASDKGAALPFPGEFINKDPTVLLVTRKALAPSDEEVNLNPRSRSAKLRVIEKI